MLLIEAVQNAKLGRSRFILYIQSKSNMIFTSIDQFINYIRGRLNAFSVISVERQAEKTRVIRLLEKKQKRLKEQITSAQSEMDELKKLKKLINCYKQRSITQKNIKLLSLSQQNSKVFSKQSQAVITDYYEKLIKIVDGFQNEKNYKQINEIMKVQNSPKKHELQYRQEQIMKQGIIKEGQQSKYDKKSVQLSKKIGYDKKSSAPKHEQDCCLDERSYLKDIKCKCKNYNEQNNSVLRQGKSQFEAYFGKANFFIQNCQIKLIQSRKNIDSS